MAFHEKITHVFNEKIKKPFVSLLASGVILGAGAGGLPHQAFAGTPDNEKSPAITSLTFGGGPLVSYHAPYIGHIRNHHGFVTMQMTTNGYGDWMAYHAMPNSNGNDSYAVGWIHPKRFSFEPFGVKTEMSGIIAFASGYSKLPRPAFIVDTRFTLFERKTNDGTLSIGANIQTVPAVVVTSPFLSVQYKFGKY